MVRFRPGCVATRLKIELLFFWKTRQGKALFEGDPNQNVFGTGKSLEWQGNDNDPSAAGNNSRLREKLNEADTERRKAQEEAEKRERAAEIRREERLAKIAYMNEMADNTPAGTGRLVIFLFFRYYYIPCLFDRRADDRLVFHISLVPEASLFALILVFSLLTFTYFPLMPL